MEFRDSDFGIRVFGAGGNGFGGVRGGGGERKWGMDLFASEFEFAATRAEALRQWRGFLPKAGRYAAVRNRVEAGHGNVSRLSPAIRLRLITEDEVVAETLERYAFSTVEKWLQEVCWRRYWKGWLELRPGVWRDYRQRLARAVVSERAEAVMAGRSGVAVMDAFARELVQTGYLHNHARMWWASFWIHAEGLPWEVGADFFERHLLDADAASNTLSWRWVAGLQTRGKTYLVRRSNVEKYVEELGDAAGLERLEDGRVKERVPEETADLSTVELPDCADRSAVAGLSGRAGLWIHEEDLSVECSEELAALKPAAVTAVLNAGLIRRCGLSAAREAHLALALEDACQRAEAHYAVGATLKRGQEQDLAAHLLEWARWERLEAVVAMRPFTGPLGDEVRRVEEALGAAGVRLVWVRRASDAAVLPLAKRGFFPFWEAMSRRLAGQTRGGSRL